MDSAPEFLTESSSSATRSPSPSSLWHQSPWSSPHCIKRSDEHQTASPFPSSSSDLDQSVSRQLLEDEFCLQLSSTPSPETENISVSPAMMFLAAFGRPAHVLLEPDAEGQLVHGYVLGPVIGHGGFSVIRRATSQSGDVVAVKIVRRSDLEKQADATLARKRLNHEAHVWASLNHEYILPLFFAEHTPSVDFFFTLLCPAGSLYDILIRDGRPSLPHDEVGRMFRQIVQGVRYLHEIVGYVHRDIKLENVLVDELGACRISDFGITRKIGQVDDEIPGFEGDQHSPIRHHRHSHTRNPRTTKSILNSHPSSRHHLSRHRRISAVVDEDLVPVHPAHAFEQGSLPYASPELLQPQASRFTGANPAQDIWALGVLLYALLTGRLPFFDPFEPRLQMKILHGAYDMPSDISRGAKHVLKGCLERCVSSRWTIAMVDEMALGIGWQQVHETSPVADKDEFKFVDCHRSPSSNLRASSRAWHGGRSKETSPRRSNRSVSTGSSLSTRCTSRSISRPPIIRYPLSPTYNELTHSLLSSSPSMPPLDIGGSDLIVPPGPSHERGRKSKKSDFSPSNRFAPSVATSSRPSEFSGGLTGDLFADVDTTDNTARWASSVTTMAETSAHSCDTTPSAIEGLKAIQEAQSPGTNKRAESTPPASGAWGRRSRPCIKEHPPSSQTAEVHTPCRFLREPNTTPPLMTPKSGARSRSVGYDARSAPRYPH